MVAVEAAVLEAGPWGVSLILTDFLPGVESEAAASLRLFVVVVVVVVVVVMVSAAVAVVATVVVILVLVALALVLLSCVLESSAVATCSAVMPSGN